MMGTRRLIKDKMQSGSASSHGRAEGSRKNTFFLGASEFSLSFDRAWPYFKYCPVMLSGFPETSSGVPAATRPPALPPPRRLWPALFSPLQNCSAHYIIRKTYHDRRIIHFLDCQWPAGLHEKGFTMKLHELFGQGRTIFSCEVFPPMC